MQHISKAFALAGAAFISISATTNSVTIQSPANMVPSSLPAVFIPPTQEQVVDQAVSEFRAEFMARVANNDRSGYWDHCYSTRGKHGAILPYDVSAIKFLRQIDNQSRENVEVSFGAPGKKLSASLLDVYSANESYVPEITKPIIVIDLGHGEGGWETGADEGDVLEAKVADAVGTKLADIMRSEYNAIVVMTRSPFGERDELMLGRSTRFGNQDKSLQIRAETANYLRETFPETDVTYISIHTNRAVGPEGIISGIHGGLVFSHSQRENGASTSDQSRSLARHIASSFRMRNQTEARTNDYAVLRCQPEKAAAVLLELGFNTNPDDRAIFSQILRSDRVAGKYALQIADGMGAYLSERNTKSMITGMQIASAAP